MRSVTGCASIARRLLTAFITLACCAGVTAQPAHAGVQPLFGLGLVDAMSADLVPQRSCSSTYVDSTCPGGTLRASYTAGHFLLDIGGRLAPGYVLTATLDGSSKDAAYITVRAAADSNGVISVSPIDFRFYASPGDRLRIRVQVSNGTAGTNATAVEYALMVALI